MAYENFMCNKDFHPSNFRNLRKMYEAEERLKREAKRQEELRQQYLKEQEIYQSKELMGRANPLGFMYEPPPGMSKEQQDKAKAEASGEPKLKFDWQRQGRAAPREEYAKDMELRDKPFGIEVRNVKCIKCGKWGHINTDRECPLFGKAKPHTEGEPVKPTLPDLDTVEDGLIFRQCVRDRVVDPTADNQQIVTFQEDEEEEGRLGEMLAGFSKRERKRILKKLAKMESSKKHRKKSSKRKKRRHSESEEASSLSDSDDGKRKRKRVSESTSDEDYDDRKKHKKQRIPSPNRDQPRDHSRDHHPRDSSRDHHPRDSSRDRQPRDSSRDHQQRDHSRDRHPRDSSRDKSRSRREYHRDSSGSHRHK